MSSIDPLYSEVERVKRDRSTVGVALLSPNEEEIEEHWCKICRVKLISQENATVWFCPSCGTKTLTTNLIHSSKIRAKYGPYDSGKQFAVSQTQKQRRRGGSDEYDDEDLSENVPGHITKQDIEDLKSLGVEVTSVSAD